MLQSSNRMRAQLWDKVGQIKRGPVIETSKFRLKLHLLKRSSRSSSLKEDDRELKIQGFKHKGNNYLSRSDLSLNLASIEERTSSLSKYETILAKKEQKILDHIERKQQNIKKRRSLSGVIVHQNYIAQRKHSQQSFITLEENTMKPTDRYFKQLSNIRLAEKILLVKPSQQCSKKTAGKFYKKQEAFKKNISRLSSISLKTDTIKQSETKRLRRQKWA